MGRFFSCLCFICGNEGVNDLNSHGKANLQAGRAPGLGAAALRGLGLSLAAVS